jgi:cell division protein FtsN
MEGQQLYLSGFRNQPPQGPNRHRISLPVDMLILVSVALVLLLILSFSLGVERGKRLTSNMAVIKESDVALDDILTDRLAQEEGVEQKQVIEKPKEAVTDKKAEERKEEKIRYKIQVASFYKENIANKAAEDLQKQGYQAFVDKKGKFMVVYVGNFEDETKAKQALQALRKQFKDCILRRL